MRIRDLSNCIALYIEGLRTIDDDLSYLFGHLPIKIRAVADAVMGKAERRFQTDLFVAGINMPVTAAGSVLHDCQTIKKVFFCSTESQK